MRRPVQKGHEVMQSPSLSVTDKFRVEYKGRGSTSKKDITVIIESGEPGSGIVFSIMDARPESKGAFVTVPARVENVSTRCATSCLAKTPCVCA